MKGVSPLPVGVLIVTLSFTWLLLFPRLVTISSLWVGALYGSIFIFGAMIGVGIVGTWLLRKIGLV